MTCLHMVFVLSFIPVDGRTKLGRTAAERLLTLASLLLTKDYYIEGLLLNI
jgi:hypothetical protein